VTLKKYRKKADQTVSALQLTLAIDELRYQKWGSTQRAKSGDWLVQNGDESYTVEQASFANTYTPLGNTLYRKSNVVWAEVAETPGQIHTKEGTSAYVAGDYLVYNKADRSDGYAVRCDKFHDMYQESSDAMSDTHNDTQTSSDVAIQRLGIEDYLKTRVNDQISWYERKSALNKNYFKRLQVVAIVCGAAIPVLTVFEDPAVVALIRPLIAVLGSAVAVISATINLYKFSDNWVKYRTAAQLLTREKNLFLTQTVPYAAESASQAFKLFVQNCETIMSAENSEWNQMFGAKQEKEVAKE
jgi:hypothetical protein